MLGLGKRKKYSPQYYEVLAIKESIGKLRDNIPKADFTTKMMYRFRTIEGILESLRMDFTG